MSDIYAITVYRYKNNELCSAFEEAKENEDFVRLVDFNATEKRLKKRIRELSEKQAEDRQSYYECLHKQDPIKPNNKKCNLATCRYNKDGKCTNEEKRKECVRVSKAVLVIDDLADIEVPDNQLIENKNPFNVCNTNPNCECDPTNCGYSVEYSTLEDAGNGIHKYMCGRDKCKYCK